MKVALCMGLVHAEEVLNPSIHCCMEFALSFCGQVVVLLPNIGGIV